MQGYNSSEEKKNIDQARLVTDQGIAKVLKERASVVTINGCDGFYLTNTRIYGFKKLQGRRIANLVIPQNTLLFYRREYGKKIRASTAYVHSIWDPYNKKFTSEGVSLHTQFFTYEVGKWVTPTAGFDHKPLDCTSGIHFFFGLKEALEY